MMNQRSLWLSSAATAAVVGWTVYRYLQKREANPTYSKNNEESKSRSFPDAPLPEIQVHPGAEETKEPSKNRILARGSVTIAHASVTGTCAKMAQQLYDDLLASGVRNVQLGTTEEWDFWDEFINDEGDDEDSDQALPVLILLLPTYTGGTWPPGASQLEAALNDLQNDWRVADSPLKKKLQVAIWGMGSSEYDEAHANPKDRSMGRPARQAVRYFQKLGARSIVRLRVGDDAVGDSQETFGAWKLGLLKKLAASKGKKSEKGSIKPLPAVQEDACGCGNGNAKESTGGCCQRGGNHQEQQPTVDEEDYDYDSDEDEGEPEVMDLEDMGEVVAPKNKHASSEPREMVTPRQAQALKKEGYKLIGTHSAVKLCRWTKHQLRGRGGCYKHTFYGITSYQVSLLGDCCCLVMTKVYTEPFST